MQYVHIEFRDKIHETDSTDFELLGVHGYRRPWNFYDYIIDNK